MTHFTPRSNLVTQAFVWEKVKIIYFFGNFCSLRSQSCLKHSTQWVNEVEWVSMVKVILWPWSKVTQISKLNVWLLACILRWAIQGLLALLIMKEKKQTLGLFLKRSACFRICVFSSVFIMYPHHEGRGGVYCFWCGSCWRRRRVLSAL